MTEQRELELLKVPAEVGRGAWPSYKTIYTLNLVHGMPGLYEVETGPKDSNKISGIIDVRYDYPHKVIIDCSKCPTLQKHGEENQERVLELTPSGYGRQRVGRDAVLEVEDESKRYRSKTTNSKRNWQRQRRYRRWLADTCSERYKPMGFCH